MASTGRSWPDVCLSISPLGGHRPPSRAVQRPLRPALIPAMTGLQSAAADRRRHCGPQFVPGRRSPEASQLGAVIVSGADERHHLTGALLAQVVPDHQVAAQVGHTALGHTAHRAQRAALVDPRVLLQRVARLVLRAAHRAEEGSWNTEPGIRI